MPGVLDRGIAHGEAIGRLERACKESTQGPFGLPCPTLLAAKGSKLKPYRGVAVRRQDEGSDGKDSLPDVNTTLDACEAAIPRPPQSCLPRPRPL